MKIKFTAARIIRIILAALALISALGAVWFFPGTEKWFMTQIGSDLLKCASWSAVALIGIVILTLIFGRIYCSILCPLGILQDLMGIFRKKPFCHCGSRHKIRYAVFTFVAAAFLFGLTLPLTLLMPSANFVLIVNNVFREIVQEADKVVHFLPEPVTLRPALTAVLLSWGLFIGLLILVRWKGRIYCNTLCPVGMLLGLLSRFSRYKLRIDRNKCVSCGACEKVCKAGCIDAVNKRINTEECVMCMNCVGQCKLGSVKLSSEETELPPVKQSRRAFLTAAGIGVLAGAASRIPFMEKGIPPMPPGAGSFDRFTSKCVGCGLCISACRGKVLTPSISQYGLRGFMQPYLNMYQGACQFDCCRCMEVCPCGALSLMDLSVKQRRRIGIAEYVKNRCIAYLEGSDCGACAEHCPVGALEMVPHKNTLIPKVNEKLCIGCGACQNICPVRPVQAIVVHGVKEQYTVEKPQKVQNKKLEAEDDFPF